MAEYAEALSTGRPKKVKSTLQHIMLSRAENGGVIAEHRMSQFEGKEPKFAFGKNEGGKLAAHITKHLGMQIPGNVADGAQTEDEQA